MQRWLCAALGLHASAPALLRLQSLHAVQPSGSTIELASLAVAIATQILAIVGLWNPSRHAVSLVTSAFVVQAALLIAANHWHTLDDIVLLALGGTLAGVLVLKKGSVVDRKNRMTRVLCSAATLVLLVSAIWISIRVAMLQGFVAVVRIAGASMAPTFHGNQFETHCRDCGFLILFDAENPSMRLEHVVCPNCGYSFAAEQRDLRTRPGQRVLLDRGAYWLSSPQRWEVVAAKSPDGFITKRVVGLPNEEVSIRRGELFINGMWYRKTSDEYRLVAQLVHDSSYEPRISQHLPERWTFTRHNSELTAVYHSWRCFDSPLPRTEESPIMDNDSYNQGSRRDINRVRDLTLNADLSTDGHGWLTFEYRDSDGEHQAIVNFAERKIQIQSHQKVITERRTVQTQQLLGTKNWEFAVIDGQVMLKCSGKLLIAAIVDQHVSRATPVERPLTIRAAKLDVVVNRLRIFRDVFYLAPNGLNVPWEGPRLGADEFFLIGDNVPVSRDSRLWGAVTRRDLLGKVVEWGY